MSGEHHCHDLLLPLREVRRAFVRAFVGAAFRQRKNDESIGVGGQPFAVSTPMKARLVTGPSS